MLLADVRQMLLADVSLTSDTLVTIVLVLAAIALIIWILTWLFGTARRTR